MTDPTESREDIFDHEHVTLIEPPVGWRMINFRELWAYRELLWVLITRDLKVRYKQTVLGASWAILRPLMTLVIFTIIFGKIAKVPSDGLPYPIFSLAALLPWSYFSGAIGTAGTSLIGSSGLVSKVYFPRLIIPLSSIGAGLVDLAISSSLLVMLMMWYGVGWTVNLLAVPPMFMLLVLTTLGIGTLLSALTVAYRDFTHITPFIVQTGMFITPVIYPVSSVPAQWQSFLYLNPMAGVVEGFRSAFLGRPFDMAGLAISTGMALLLFGAAVAYFERVERRFADII